jgi:hypothetical protein
MIQCNPVRPRHSRNQAWMLLKHLQRIWSFNTPIVVIYVMLRHCKLRCQPFLALVRLSAQCLELTAAHLTKSTKDGLSLLHHRTAPAACDHTQPHCCFEESLTAYVVKIYRPFILFRLHRCRCCCHGAKLRMKWPPLLKQPKISKFGDCRHMQRQGRQEIL